MLFRSRPSLGQWKNVANFGGWITGAGFATTGCSEGIKFVLGGLLTPGSVALYERAEQLPRLSRQALFAPVGRVLVPSFSRKIEKRQSIGADVEAYVAALTVLLWPMCGVMGFISVPLVVFLFGENWRMAGEILPFLLAAMAIRAALPTPNEILIPHGLVRRLAMLRFSHFIFTVALGTLGALHSLEMFAILQILVSILFLTANYLAIRNHIDTSIRSLLPHYRSAAIVTLITALPPLSAFFYYSSAMDVTILGLTFGLAGVFWLFGLYVVGHPLTSEITRARKMLIERYRVRRAVR